MNAVDLALVGCGGMGRRHLYGIDKLNQSLAAIGESPSVRLAVVIDHERDRAAQLADEAQNLLGYKPMVATELETAMRHENFTAVDLCTATESHHVLGTVALEGGRDLLVEKPLASTIRASRMLVSAAKASGRVLAVAENVRREPVNRFAKAIIQSGVIGDIRMVVDLTLTGSNSILLTPWRHRRFTGGALLDVGVHNADIIEYLAGPVQTVIGVVRLDECQRYRRKSSVASHAFYEQWKHQLPKMVAADADDVGLGLLAFQSGATGQWSLHQAAHGQSRTLRVIHGSRGSIELPGDRSGQPPLVVTDDDGALEENQLLGLLPQYELDEVESAVWAASRVTHKQASFAEIDRSLIAIELHDFAKSVVCGSSPEVDGPTGLRNMALVYALGESSLAHRPIEVDAVVSGSISHYQDPIDAELGIFP